ncbi:hypothetical protein M3Y95_01097100 [Aphelenchoides besseyi]|nr:hypothetical protein M3Y95_01097100 [Aphelenchoides besseyi]
MSTTISLSVLVPFSERCNFRVLCEKRTFLWLFIFRSLECTPVCVIVLFCSSEMDGYSDLSDDDSFVQDEELTGLKDVQIIKDVDLQTSDCQTFTLDGLIEIINSIADNAAEVLEIKPEICKLILPLYHWSSDSLLEKFYEVNSKEKFLQKHNIPIDFWYFRFNSTPGNCAICCEISKLDGLDCGHLYCDDCWRRYCEGKIRDEAQWLFSCPSCELLINENALLRLVDDEQILSTYKRLLINSYVSTNPRIKWYPATDCIFAIEVPIAETCGVPCQCGHIFCFDCGLEWHQPAECSMMKKWAKETEEDIKSVEWKEKNSKPCPECKSPIEKNGGCNHIHCCNCNTHYCWLCNSRPWTPNHICNAFTAAQPNAGGDNRFTNADRFTHYMDRFMNHKNSMVIQKEFQVEILNKTENIRRYRECTQTETLFLQKAFDTLVKSRRTLMYSSTMSKPKCFEEQLAIDVRFDPSTQHSELIGGRKSKRTFKGFLTKYFLEGQQHYSTVRCHEGSSWHERHRNIIAFLLPFCFFQICWWTLAIRYDLFRLYKTHYAMPITMIVGAFVSGATSEGGGAVAFPVMTLLLNLDPTAARDFSLMIQSCGMAASGFTVLYMRVKVEWHSIIFCSSGAFFSVILSLQFGDNVLTSSEKKMMFVAIWFAFAIALLILNFERKRTTHDSIPEFCFWKGVVLFFTGIIGGILTGLTGSGVDITSFSILTLVFSISEKTATPTSVVLMWINSWVGFFWRHLIMSEISELAFQYWSISVPVVVTCSPAGAFVASHLHRQTLAFMVYILETLSLIGFLLTRPKFTLLLVGCAIVVAHIFIFFALSKLGKLINDGLTVEKKQESPRTCVSSNLTTPN